MGLLTREDKNFLIAICKKILKPTFDYASNGGNVFTLAAGTSQQIFEQDNGRIVATIVNSGVNPCFINFSQNVAVDGTGIQLIPGGSITFGRGTDIGYLGRVQAISTLGTTVVTTEISQLIDEVLA